MPDKKGALNENQARKLRVACQHIDHLFGEIEAALHEASLKTVFPRIVADIPPARVRVIEDYIGRMRARLLRVLDGQNIHRPGPSIPASRSVRAKLISVSISLEELAPRYMKGYGDVDTQAATELYGIIGELQSLLNGLEETLSEGEDQDLEERIKALQQGGCDLGDLAAIERVVRRQGLVEFRDAIRVILDSAGDRNFEIAVFGRVSSGKSSLLNMMLGTDVLPVGINPITAVPTRITYGETPQLVVTTVKAAPKTYEVTRLAEFATEQENPDNTRQVTRIDLLLPNPRLQDGVTFVDTPGLGSLATSGASETLAYLPRCDLGVVLVDAASTLTSDDVQTILSLKEASVPVMVLMSKADLVREQDWEKALSYMQKHLFTECGMKVPVNPVSAVPSHLSLLDQWFEKEILPLYSHSRERKKKSLGRKVHTLRDSVIGTLRVRLERKCPPFKGNTEELRAWEARLRQTTASVETTRISCRQETARMAGNIPGLFRKTAENLVGSVPADGSGTSFPGDVVRAAVIDGVRELVRPVMDSIDSLAMALERDLRGYACDLGLSDMPDEGEFRGHVRGMPVFDPGPVELALSRPALGSLLGKKYAGTRREDVVKSQLESLFRPALENYSHVLGDWADRTTGELGEWFETYARRYRAYAEESSREAQVTADEAGSILDDLKCLKSLSGTDEEDAGPG